MHKNISIDMCVFLFMFIFNLGLSWGGLPHPPQSPRLILRVFPPPRLPCWGLLPPDRPAKIIIKKPARDQLRLVCSRLKHNPGPNMASMIADS